MPAIGEAEVQYWGSALLTSARSRQPKLYQGLRGSAFKRSLHDEKLRTALFRFIDVLPQLGTDADMARHLADYLHGVPGLFPGALRLMARPALIWLIERQIRDLAKHFLVEENQGAFATILHELHTLGAETTVDAVGEAVLSSTEADTYRDRVLWQLRQDWQKQKPHVSLKLTALTPRFDALDTAGTRTEVFARLAPIVATAAELGATVTVDMEQHELKPFILDLFLQAVADFNDARWMPAIALQAYLPETGADIERMIAAAHKLGRRFGVRLVKGAYWDQERAWALQRGWPMPCYTDKAATDANYEALTARLLNNSDVLLPAIAGHNPRSLAVAIAHANTLNLKPGQWEIQMLHGMAEPLRDAVADMRLPLRIYVPTGDLLTGIAYLIRRLLENSAGNSVLRQTWLSADEFLQILAPPMAKSDTANPAPPHPPNLPLSDFSQAAARQAMATALGSLRSRLPLHDEREGHETLCPAAPALVLARTAYSDPASVDGVLAATYLAQRSWMARTVEERVSILHRVADRMEAERHDFAALQVLEAAKPWREADADVAEAVDFLRYYAARMSMLGGEHATHDFPGEHNRFRYLPRGVAAVIAPWNFPLAILAGMSAAALVTGNACVMKPALPGLLTARKFHATLLLAGVPHALCPLLIGGPELGRALVRHRHVHVIAFTGSRTVGLGILREAHSINHGYIKQVVCEMGGKNAIIVDADADLDQAVIGILESAFGYSGQKCSACSRLITVDGVGKHLLPRLIAAAKDLRWGNPLDSTFDHGPLIAEAAQKKAREYLSVGMQEARLLWQGHVPQEGFYCPPTIFADVFPHHQIAREEIFAPILAVMQARNFDHALEIANDCEYALTGGVYSRLPQHLAQAEAQFRVGNLYLNRRITGARVGVQPFGGIGLSGTGIQAGGPDYLKQFLWMQTSSSNIERHGFIPDTP